MKRTTKCSPFVRSLLSICFACLMCLLPTFEAFADTPIRVRLVEGYLVVVPVTIEGAGTFDFLLDTGTNSTIIIPELANKLALRPTDGVVLMTVAGSQIVPRARLKNLTLGSKVVNDVEVLCEDLRELRRVDRHIYGILGQNFLSHFNYMLDYRERRINFFDRDEPESLSGARLPVEQDEGGLFINLQSTGKTENYLRVKLDSGVGWPVLLLDQARKFGCEVSESSTFKASTNAGSRTLRAGRLPALQIGEERLSDVPVALLQEESETANRTGDGLLPLCLFRSIYINHKRNYVILNPRALR